MEKVNHPVQGTGADGLKLAMALFYERLPEYLDAKLVIAVHDELVVECPEEQAEEVARFARESHGRRDGRGSQLLIWSRPPRAGAREGRGRGS